MLIYASAPGTGMAPSCPGLEAACAGLGDQLVAAGLRPPRLTGHAESAAQFREE